MEPTDRSPFDLLADGADAVAVTGDVKELFDSVDLDALAAGDVEAALDPGTTGKVFGRQLGRVAVRGAMGRHPARPAVEWATSRALGAAIGAAVDDLDADRQGRAEAITVPVDAEAGEEAAGAVDVDVSEGSAPGVVTIDVEAAEDDESRK